MSDDDSKRRTSLADMFSEPWPELQERIRRQDATQRAWDDDPANKDEGDFWGDVGFRDCELTMIERELKIVPAIGAQAVAARNHEQRLIKAERIALKEDEREVRSAAQTELRATIASVRSRWDKRDSIAAGLIAAEQVQGLAEHSWEPAVVDAQPAGMLGSAINQSDVGAEDTPQSAPLASVPSHADRPKATIPALTEWFRGRVATWSDIEAAPSEPDDVRAAIDHFAPGLTRDEVRTIRLDATPRQWRTQGPRKPWGDVKPKAAE